MAVCNFRVVYISPCFGGFFLMMASAVNSNFITEFKVQRKARKFKKQLIFDGKKKDYSSVHSLIIDDTYQNIQHFNKAAAIFEIPAVIRLLNEARDYFVDDNDCDKAYDCFKHSLNLRNRQRENIDNELLFQIEQWQIEKILHLSKKGYEAYKHTRYLAIESLARLILAENEYSIATDEVRNTVNNYAKSGKLKGFYRFYLKNKIFLDPIEKSLAYLMLKRGLKDPLIQKMIAGLFINNESLNLKPCNRYVELYIAILVEHGNSYPNLKIDNLYPIVDSLENSDEKTLITAMGMVEGRITFDELEGYFFKLKKASSRYQLIKLLKGTNAEIWVYRLVKNACKWNWPTFVAGIFKLLFDDKKYHLIEELYALLPVSHRQHKQIFSFYIGSLRGTDQLNKAKECLASPPKGIPELNIIVQQFYIYKKEKKFTLALEKAYNIYNLQAQKNKQRWSMAIVELLAAEGDFEAAYEYVSQHPEYRQALLPLIHFREGTLVKIEDNLKLRILEGEENNELHYYLSYLHCERKEYREAIDHITQAIGIKVNRRNSLHYILLKTVVEKDFAACLNLIRDHQLDSDLLFAKYYAYSLIQLSQLSEAEDYLNERVDTFNTTEKGRNERLLLLSNTARLSGDYEKSFDLFASIFPEDQRCFTSKDKETKSFAVMNLKSTAKILKNENQPLISVIMTNYGWTEYTSVAIQSILDQTHSNFELIIVDDRSESNAYRKLAKFVRRKKDKRIKLIRLKINSGTYRAKNNGLKVAKGEYITFQDSDDWSHPNRLTVQFDKLLSMDVLALVVNYCRVDNFGIVNLHNGNIMRKGPITLFYKREVIDTLGYFDSVRTSADSEYLGRITTCFGNDALFHYETPYYIASYHDRSLTSYGPLSLDPILGVKGARREYSLAYKAWHKKATSETNDMYIKFPLKHRLFKTPLLLSL